MRCNNLFAAPLFLLLHKYVIDIVSCLIKRILQFQSAVAFGPVKITNAEGIDITNTCLFGWSSDGACWTNWVNYNTYLRLAKNVETDFYLRVLITDSVDKVFLNNMETKCYNMCLYDENPFLESLCNENLFNPYIGLDCALLLQQQLADSVICMLGIPIYYFKVSPQKETADYTFKEYVMHNVESVKQIKLMINADGTMPSSKPQFTDLDFDWEVDWDVELSKTEFARAFGDTAFPKQRDFIYVPMMKRMWEVNSAYDEKNEGLLWHSTTWKLGLIKWNEKTNVEQGDFDKFIDNLVVNKYENVFAELEENEQSRTTATTQIERPTYTADTISNVFLQDAIRKSMSKDTISITEKQYNQGSIVIAKNIYSFNTPDSLITYQKGYCGEDGTLIFLLNNTGIKQFEYKPIISFGNICIETDGKNVKFGDAIASLAKISNGSISEDYLVICRWSRKDFVQEIQAYPYIAPKDMPIYYVKPEMYKFDFTIIDEQGVCEYANDNITKKQKEVIVIGYPVKLTNIKLYNKYLSKEDALKEAVKYTTKSECCVFNDVARPLDSGNGYSPK